MSTTITSTNPVQAKYSSEFANLITNVLNNNYLRNLLGLVKVFEENDQAKLTMTRTSNRMDDDPLRGLSCGSLREMYLDVYGIHIVVQGENTRVLAYGSKRDDVMPHAIYFAEKHGAFLVGNGIERMASNIARNAATLEHKLSQANS